MEIESLRDRSTTRLFISKDHFCGALTKGNDARQHDGSGQSIDQDIAVDAVSRDKLILADDLLDDASLEVAIDC